MTMKSIAWSLGYLLVVVTLNEANETLSPTTLGTMNDVIFPDELDSSPIDAPTSFMNFYRVNTTINERLARSEITMEFESRNNNCMTIRKIWMEWPYQARMIHLQTESNDGCLAIGEVQPIADAQETFMNSSSTGGTVALVQAWDATNYEFQVSIPANGKATVKIVLEELLQRRQGKVTFRVPLVPYANDIGRLEMHLTIHDKQTEKLDDFNITNVGDRSLLQVDWNPGSASATANLITDTLSADKLAQLPRIVEGYFDAGSLPENGILYRDVNCFVHTLNPGNFLSQGEDHVPRNIVFVIDVSGSMQGQRLEDAKKAFNRMIQFMNADEFLSVQTFSNVGTEALWGPALATSKAKNEAQRFVSKLVTIGFTHLSGAFEDALVTAKSKDPASFVPIIVLMTDGEPTSGETNRKAIARNVWNANRDGTVKIFGIAFGRSADLSLLLSVALQTGGRAIRVYEGYGDSDSQMQDFFASELGEVLLSDIHLSFLGIDGPAPLLTETQSSFAVLSRGSELVVRGVIDLDSMGSTVRALATANSREGQISWAFEAEIDSLHQKGDTEDEFVRSHCHQSFAHARIAELMTYNEAANVLDRDLLDYVPSLADLCGPSENIHKCLHDAALELAIRYQVMWPGLTAMVTIENDICRDSMTPIDVCWEGDGDADATRSDLERNGGGAGWASASVRSSSFVIVMLTAQALIMLGCLAW